MNKIEALKTLSNAYWYVRDVYGDGNADAAECLEDKFNYLRRALRLTDLRPALVHKEGFNGRMPTYF